MLDHSLTVISTVQSIGIEPTTGQGREEPLQPRLAVIPEVFDEGRVEELEKNRMKALANEEEKEPIITHINREENKAFAGKDAPVEGKVAKGGEVGEVGDWSQEYHHREAQEEDETAIWRKYNSLGAEWAIRDAHLRRLQFKVQQMKEERERLKRQLELMKSEEEEA
ncbi:hypothetical protein Hypma_009523 [Hypsizygus marmoreus]|uniref:Uncharacterized protein n=1 Tax=Hypsizygus marmoreus TaxID=39966 RepID=A0A369JYH4_HYPMA|nr:hypothetical protein Hypma_009523 [Hypsizygus marmoreus]